MATETTPEKIRQQQFKWLTDNGAYTARSGDAEDTTTTIYTVPANKVLYIFSANLRWYITAANVKNVVVLSIGGSAVGSLSSTGIDGDSFSVSYSYPIPIKLTATQTCTIKSFATNLYGSGTIIGYLFDA